MNNRYVINNKLTQGNEQNQTQQLTLYNTFELLNSNPQYYLIPEYMQSIQHYQQPILQSSCNSFSSTEPNLTDLQLMLPSFSGSFPEEDTQFSHHIRTLLQRNLPIFTFHTESDPSPQPLQPPCMEQKSCFLTDKIFTYNRKAKSLQELSKKFIQHFEGKGNNIIQLDKITHELAVERRRIYDVINILQSLNVVTKKGKNHYQWKGLCQAVTTINLYQSRPENLPFSNPRKEKSLQYLASGFLNLFINWKPAISLQQAVKHLMKEMQDSAVKTKIRRLYDIINVFRSLGLVRKATLPSKRPGYEWAGTQYLQHLIMKKQYCDQNTGLNELHQEEDIQIPQDRSSLFLGSKNTNFSPFVCPQIPKSTFGNFKLLNSTQERSDLWGERSGEKELQDDIFGQPYQFHVFRKTLSAFSLVGDVKK